jgi:hypothetical protein
MSENKYTKLVSGEADEAKAILKWIAKHQPKDDGDTVTRTPIIRLAEAGLEEIAKHGGKFDPLFIGQLCATEDLADIQGHVAAHDKSWVEAMETRSELANTIAHAIVDAGLVELPIISRSRSVAK